MMKIPQKRGCKIEYLQDVVNTLATGRKLDKKYRDHTLAGNYTGFRECHIEPDWLLIYHISQDSLELFLLRTGTHPIYSKT